MNAKYMSEALREIGIHYAEGSIRAFYSRGAPRDSATAFAAWVAANAKRKTAASTTAKDLLALQSSQHGLAVILSLLQQSNTVREFWIPAAPIFWDMHTANAGQGEPVGKLLGDDGFKALLNVITGLSTLLQKAPEVHAKLKAAGISCDCRPWLDAALHDPEGTMDRACEAYERFAALK